METHGRIKKKQNSTPEAPKRGQETIVASQIDSGVKINQADEAARQAHALLLATVATLV